MIHGRGELGATARERKRELRAEALRRRRSIPARELAGLSARVAANLRSLPEYGRAGLIVSYCAKGDEVQTSAIIETALGEGKRVAVVVVTDPRSKTLSFSEIKSFADDLAPGTFGIPEPKEGHGRPIPVDEADLILVPLVAWDEKGHRLGYGAGYFDRALAQAKGIAKVGLALEAQRLPQIPESKHDVSLDVIVTERRVVRPHG